jgi:SAM-dependent methyltransferase
MASRDSIPHEHDRTLAEAFDGQAAQFERSPLQSDPAPLERLVRFGDMPADSLVLDVGCGPGLVALAILQAGHRVFGVDLSPEMVARADARCAAFGGRARFQCGSVFDSLPTGFDAAISRYVVHHVSDPLAFLVRQVEVVRPDGVVIVCDHTTDPDPARAAWHQVIERARDRTHTSNQSPGALVDLMTRAGLVNLRSTEESFTLDFDEWFDRGTPALSKSEVLAQILAGPGARGFQPIPGTLQIACWRSFIRGERT